MVNTLNVTTEQVDDFPVLVAQGKKTGIPELLDRHFAPHGNWQGTSLSWTGLVWLSHSLSEGDHRLNRAEVWAEKRLRILTLIEYTARQRLADLIEKLPFVCRKSQTRYDPPHC